MKRVLLLAFSLAALIALIARATRPERPSGAPLASEVAAAREPAPIAITRLESENSAAPLEREANDLPTRVEQATDSRVAQGPYPGPLATVRGYAAKRLTQERVRGEATLLVMPPGEERAAQDRSLSANLDQHLRRSQLDEQGRFQFELPVGTRLFELTVMPPAPADGFPYGQFDGARAFVIRSQILNSTLGEAGLDL